MEHVPPWIAVIITIVTVTFGVAKLWNDIGRRARLENLKLQLEHARMLIELEKSLPPSEPSDGRTLSEWIASLRAECIPKHPAESKDGESPFKSSSDEPRAWLRSLDMASHNAFAPPVMLTLFIVPFGSLAVLNLLWGVDLPRTADFAVLALPIYAGLVLNAVFKVARALHGMAARIKK